MKRKGFAWLEIAVGMGVIALLTFIFLSLFWRSRIEAKKSTCLMNLKQIGLALMQYSQDANGKLPRITGAQVPSATTPYGWADALHPYIKKRQVFQCPQEANEGSNASPTQLGYTDYWFNRRLSGINMRGVREPSRVILFGDGNDGSDLTDARYNLTSFTNAWINNQKSPLFRHGVGAFDIFVDGHARRLTPSQIANNLATQLYTFSPK